jgi:hypothetical protein
MRAYAFLVVTGYMYYLGRSPVHAHARAGLVNRLLAGKEIMSQKKCAYCGTFGPFTREHIWPAAFLERRKGLHAHYSPSSGNVHGADYIVRDVCKACNNGNLSVLDSYFCSIYDNYFKEPKGAGSEVTFNYDYNLLARALLKIAYNTARGANSEVMPLQRYSKYILNGEPRPEGLAVICELVSPSYIKDPDDPTQITEILPTMYRSARAEFQSPNGSAFLVRIVAVNSFYFHMLVVRDPNNLECFYQGIREFLEGVKGTIILLPENDQVTLSTSPQDGLRSMLPLLKAKRTEYRNFFDAYRKKGGKNNS